MFTATPIAKIKDELGRLTITVRFTDGESTYEEVIKPQDEAGFNLWVKSRLESLETGKKLETDDNLDKPLVFNAPADTRTAAEIERDEWLVKYRRWVNIKNNLIDTGILIGNEAPVVAYLSDVKAGFKPGYINFI